MIVATGEQVTGGLLAIALQNLGVDARSWLGWQIAIQTDDIHSSARIEDIDVSRLEDGLNQGQVAVVAGFRESVPKGGSPHLAGVAQILQLLHWLQP